MNYWPLYRVIISLIAGMLLYWMMYSNSVIALEIYRNDAYLRFCVYAANIMLPLIFAGAFFVCLTLLFRKE